LEIVIPLLESVPEVNRQDVKSRRRIANAYTLLGQSLILQNQNIKARECDNALGFVSKRMATLARAKWLQGISTFWRTWLHRS
ncbi:MAG: hypothetical protein ACK5OC_07955, partial [Pirellula sp.]